jgi:ribosomal protein L32
MKKLSEKIQAKVYGQCDTCGKTNTPGHTCRVKFNERSAAALRKRLDRRET